MLFGDVQVRMFKLSLAYHQHNKYEYQSETPQLPAYYISIARSAKQRRSVRFASSDRPSKSPLIDYSHLAKH
jgi:hypothetical protein